MTFSPVWQLNGANNSDRPPADNMGGESRSIWYTMCNVQAELLSRERSINTLRSGRIARLIFKKGKDMGDATLYQESSVLIPTRWQCPHLSSRDND